MARYSDDYVASAVLMLEAAGYPQKEGGLESVYKALRKGGKPGPARTSLTNWYNRTKHPVESTTVEQKRAELQEVIRDEVYAAFQAAGAAREEATYKDLITAAAILIDKLQLLNGGATERTEIVDARERVLGRMDSIAARIRTGQGAIGVGSNGHGLAGA